MSALQVLLDALARKPPDARADFVGHLAFNVLDDLDVGALPADMRADLDRFIDRAGFEEEDSAEQTRARIDAHFDAHALDAELLALFDALEGAVAAAQVEGSSEQGRAASAVLGNAESLKPVGADGRKPGTLAGGLMGLVAARTGKAAPARPTPVPPASVPPATVPPATVPPATMPTANQAPAGAQPPNQGFAR